MSQSGARPRKRKGPAGPVDLPDPEAPPAAPDSPSATLMPPPAKVARVALPDPMPAAELPAQPPAPSRDPTPSPIIKLSRRSATPMGPPPPPPPSCPPSPALSHVGSVASTSLADPEHFAVALAALQDPARRPETRKVQLNAKGELVDAHGNKVDLDASVATLKANLHLPKPPLRRMRIAKAPDLSRNPYFDAQLAALPGGSRKPRPLKFLDPGSIIKRAEKLRTIQRSQQLYEKRQAAQAFAGKETEANPNLIPVGAKPPAEEEDDPALEAPPAMEWWDDRLLAKDLSDRRYLDIAADLRGLNTRLLNLLVDHPVPVPGPNQPAAVGPLPLMLTKAERKRIRTQGRIAREKEKQENIKLGLLEPPKPRVKVNNLMRVLGTEATQDPTAMEKFVRAEMEARRNAHDARNQERKLTPEERRRKHLARAQRAARNDPVVTVFKVGDLSSKQKKFKVSQNASQLMLTGCAVLTPTLHFIVVEGGLKPMRKFIHLLLDRIKWEEDPVLDAAGQPVLGADGVPERNWCALVWQGLVSAPLFVGFKLQRFDAAARARAFLVDKGVVHYYDMVEKFAPGAAAGALDLLSDEEG